MRLSRKATSTTGMVLPQDWSEGLARLLNLTYKVECTRENRYFDASGQIFPEELLVVVSYLPEQDESLTPMTLFLSCDADQIQTEDKVKETQENYVALVGLFFDEIFAQDDWNEFEPNWQEVTHRHQNYWYRISRENINLTFAADKLLGDDFEEL